MQQVISAKGVKSVLPSCISAPPLEIIYLCLNFIILLQKQNLLHFSRWSEMLYLL